jgi:hypothetical protein
MKRLLSSAPLEETAAQRSGAGHDRAGLNFWTRNINPKLLNILLVGDQRATDNIDGNVFKQEKVRQASAFPLPAPYQPSLRRQRAGVCGWRAGQATERNSLIRWGKRTAPEPLPAPSSAPASPAASPRPGVDNLSSARVSTVKYLLRTEVHTFAFSVAANAILSFFPFVLLLMTLIRRVFHSRVMYEVVVELLCDYLPAGQEFLIRNLNAPVEARQRAQIASLLILLVTSTGVLLPLEGALNRIWGFPKNRSYLGNQLVSLGRRWPRACWPCSQSH